MAVDWLLEFLKGTLKIFLHPLFYYSFFLAAAFGVARVKRERKNFGVRTENAYFELRQLLPLGLIIGIALSIVTMVVGIALPFASVVLIGIVSLLLGCTTKLRLLSPAYTVGLAFFMTIFVGAEQWENVLLQRLFQNLDEKIYPSMALLVALLLIAEGLLIYMNGKKGTSPKLTKSKRGLIVGLHEVKRMWLLPLFLFVPGSVLEPPFQWWPVFTLGTENYSILFLPFLLGFHQTVRGILPKEAIEAMGKRVLFLGVFLTVLSVSMYWYNWMALVIVVIAIVGREILSFRQQSVDENLPFYFSKKSNGLMILGILPMSPAHKMSLQVGEIITKVNGLKVVNEQEFYEALQRNRAHCKLEVLDVFGQIRFVQRALYEGDHHELGILFVQEEKKWGSKAI